MNTEEKLYPSNITDLIEKMNESLRSFAIKETEWIIQKNAYESKVSELEGEIQAHEQINIDLMKRIRMLEYSLTQERNKNKSNNDQNRLIITEENNEIQIPDKKNLISEDEINKLKEKTIRPSLLSMLNDIGINETFANDLFTNLEINKIELERLIKKDIEERTNSIQKNMNKQNELNQNNSKENKLKADEMEMDNTKVNLQQSYFSFKNQETTENKTQKTTPFHSQNQYYDLKFHLDVVRKLSYIKKYNCLVSVSEDCLINIWNMNNFFENINSINDFEPTITFRGHTGPLFSLETKEDIIYTAGNEGQIKIWQLPNINDYNIYGDSELLFNSNIAFYHVADEVVIWDIKHHPSKNLIVSSVSNGNLYFYKTTTSHEEYIQSLNERNLEKWFMGTISCSKNNIINSTCCHYLKYDTNILISGHTDGNISFIDINKLSIISNSKNSKNFQSLSLLDKQTLSPNQVNTIDSQFANGNIFCGFEDGTIKYFDYRTEVGNYPVKAHNDAITSLSLMNDLYLFSSSHDTKVKMWDLRDLSQPLNEFIGSQKKWDESIYDILLIKEMNALATAGADSIIRIFKI